jgi:hypothetical protein
VKWENLLLFPLFGFVQWPFAALVPAIGFAVAGAIRRRPLAGLAGAVWFSYALYEAGMKARLLCSGECNIRVDLLFIYPLVWVLTIVALIQLLRRKNHGAA